VANPVPRPARLGSRSRWGPTPPAVRPVGACTALIGRAHRRIVVLRSRDGQTALSPSRRVDRGDFASLRRDSRDRTGGDHGRPDDTSLGSLASATTRQSGVANAGAVGNDRSGRAGEIDRPIAKRGTRRSLARPLSLPGTFEQSNRGRAPRGGRGPPARPGCASPEAWLPIRRRPAAPAHGADPGPGARRSHAAFPAARVRAGQGRSAQIDLGRPHDERLCRQGDCPVRMASVAAQLSLWGSRSQAWTGGSRRRLPGRFAPAVVFRRFTSRRWRRRSSYFFRRGLLRLNGCST